MTLAAAERARLADALLAAGPDAPTLCEGWRTADLAVHLWERERDPLAMVAGHIPPLAGLATRRGRELRSTRGYDRLVEDFRSGPGVSLFALPGVDAKANALEYFVHHEDVRRAIDPSAAPRELSREEDDELWTAATAMSRLLLRGAPVQVVLERAGTGPADRVLAVRRAGRPQVTVRGPASELALFAFGRRSVAEVEVTGTVPAVAALLGRPSGL